jgi:hypothetical protein
MDSNANFNLTIFTDITKNICMCTAVSIAIIVLFIITPLNQFIKTSVFMKLIALIILVYTIYLNSKQTNLLRDASSKSITEQIKSQLTINIMCSYVFTIFIGLLVIFIVKSFF